MQNVTVVPRRQSMASGLMADMLPMIQQQEAQKAAEQERIGKLHELYLKSIMAEADPGRRAAAYASAPPEVQAMMPNPASLPAPAKTPAQLQQEEDDKNLQATIDAGSNDPTPVVGQSMNAPATSRMNVPSLPSASGGSDAPAYEGAGDTVPQRDAPTPAAKYAAAFAKYVQTYHQAPPKEEQERMLTEATAGDEGLTQRSSIIDKRSLSAEETTKVPLTQAEIAEKNAAAGEHKASAAKNYAEVGKIGAETGKIGEETKGLKQTNALTSGLSSGTAAPSVPLDKADPTVRAIVERRFDITLLRKKPELLTAYFNAASQYDPTINTQDYPEQFAIKKDFTPGGKSGRNVTSLNTAISHLYDMWTASKKIDNFNNIPLGNTAVNAGLNWLKKNSGDLSKGAKPLIDYADAATGASTELATLYKGGVGTEGEVHEWRNNVDPNQSAGNRNGSIQQLVHMIGARFEPMEAQYSRTGRSLYTDEKAGLNAKSKVLLQRMGIDPQTFEIVGAGSATAPAAPPAPVAKPKSDPLGIF